MTIVNDMLRKTTRFEHYRRIAYYLRAHRATLVAAGAGKRELCTIDETIKEMDWMIAMSDWGQPPDTPEPDPPAETPHQPLCPPGAEAWMFPFIDGLAS